MNAKLVCAVSTMITCWATNCTAENSLNKPNILVILLDDAGYNDFGFNGSKDLLTPNIDRLAADGTVFTDAHVSAYSGGYPFSISGDIRSVPS